MGYTHKEGKTMTNDTYLSGIKAAYRKFNSELLEFAVSSNGKKSWNNGEYVLQFFPSGNYEVTPTASVDRSDFNYVVFEMPTSTWSFKAIFESWESDYISSIY